MRRKHLAWIAMGTGIAVLLSRRGDVSDWTEATVRQEELRPKKVVYWTSSGSPQVDRKRAREFMQTRPDTTVSPNFRHSGGLRDILFISFLSGNPPDYRDAKVNELRKYVLMGGIMPLDELLEKEGEDYLLQYPPFVRNTRIHRFKVNPDDRFIRPLAMRGLENLWGMVLWLTSFGVGNALLMAGFVLTLPREVEEAASVDGAGAFRTFFDVGLPMARPIVMTVGLFAFLTAWNNFLVPLLCTISRPSMQPLAVAVYNFQQGHPGKWQQINAAASIMIVPVILLFLVLQKHVVKSIAVGAVKG